jgi:hypothetical protein
MVRTEWIFASVARVSIHSLPRHRERLMILLFGERVISVSCDSIVILYDDGYDVDLKKVTAEIRVFNVLPLLGKLIFAKAHRMPKNAW